MRRVLMIPVAAILLVARLSAQQKNGDAAAEKPKGWQRMSQLTSSARTMFCRLPSGKSRPCQRRSRCGLMA